jgi:serine/threonine-protein kinase HipA
MHGKPAGFLLEVERGRRYVFEYDADYSGPPVSLVLPVAPRRFEFQGFPAVFDGLLPEGALLEGLLARRKLDRNDGFGQLVAVGRELVGAITVEAME